MKGATAQAVGGKLRRNKNGQEVKKIRHQGTVLKVQGLKRSCKTRMDNRGHREARRFLQLFQ